MQYKILASDYDNTLMLPEELELLKKLDAEEK